MYQNMFPYNYKFNPNINTYNNNTIPFKNNTDAVQEPPKEEEKTRSKSINILGMNFDIDDLIIIAIICLLFMDLEKNYTLVIILGLILLNVNLNDLFNLL